MWLPTVPPGRGTDDGSRHRWPTSGLLATTADHNYDRGESAVGKTTVRGRYPQAMNEVRQKVAAEQNTVHGNALEELTFPELVDLWAEEEIYRQLREVELHSAAIVLEAERSGDFHVLPTRGGVLEDNGSVEVLVEVRDAVARCTRIGAWKERKFGTDDARAFNRAYTKAMAHAIIQLLPAVVWRPWIQTSDMAS